MFDDIKFSSLNSLFPSNYFNHCNFNYHEVHIQHNEQTNEDKKSKKRITFHEVIREYVVPLIHKKKEEKNNQVYMTINIGTIVFHSFEDRYTRPSTFNKSLKKEGTGYKKMEAHEIKNFNGFIFQKFDIENFQNHYEKIHRKWFEKMNILSTNNEKGKIKQKKIYQFNLNTYYIMSKNIDNNNNDNNKKNMDVNKKREFFSTFNIGESLYFHWLDENMNIGLDLHIKIIKKSW